MIDIGVGGSETSDTVGGGQSTRARAHGGAEGDCAACPAVIDLGVMGGAPARDCVCVS